MSAKPNLKEYSKAFKKSKSLEDLYISLQDALAAWESRSYQSSDWQDTHIKRREQRIEILTSLIEQIENKNYLSEKQIQVAKELISNAKNLNTFIDSKKQNESKTFRVIPKRDDSTRNNSNNPINSLTGINRQLTLKKEDEKNMSTQLISTPIQPIQPTQPTQPTQQASSLSKLKSLKKSIPNTKLFPNTILFYGPNGVGKTPFWAECGDAINPIFLMTEPGAKGLSIFKLPEEQPAFNTWEEFTNAVKLLITEEHEFCPIIVDSVTGLIDLARPAALAPFGVKHENQLDFGKGTAAIAALIGPVLKTLGKKAPGLVLLGHAKYENIKTRAGNEIRKTSLLISESFRQLFMDLSDLIICMDIVDIKQPNGEIKKSQRVIYTTSTPERIARDRYNRLPKSILAEPKGKGFERLLAAWNASNPIPESQNELEEN